MHTAMAVWQYASMEDMQRDEAQWITTGVTDDDVKEDPVFLDLTPPRSLARIGGELHCFEDTCTHEDFSLSEGFLEGAVIECAYHFARFCVRTGSVLTQPASRALRVYDVRVENGKVLVAATPRPDPGRPTPASEA